MRYILLCCLICSIAVGQNPQKVSIANNDLIFTYNPNSKIFEACINTKKGKTCKSYVINSKSNMTLNEDIRAEITKFFSDEDVKYSLYGKPASVPFASEFQFSPEIEINVKDLTEKNPATLKITNALNEHFFTVEIKDSNFIISPNSSKIKAVVASDFEPIAYPFTDSIAFKKELEINIAKGLNAKLTAIQDEIKEEENKFIDASIQAIYNDATSVNEQYVFETNVDLIESTPKAAATDSNAKDPKPFKVYSYFDKGTFKLKFSVDETLSNAHAYGPYDVSISESDFITKVIAQYGAFEVNDDNKAALKTLFETLSKKTETAKEKKAAQDIEDELKSRLQKLVDAEKVFSGKIKLEKEFEVNEKKGKIFINTDITFKTEYALVHFFNDRLDNIAIVGKLSDDPETLHTLYNRKWSLPIRELLNRRQTNSFTTKDDITYRYNYQDALKFLPDDSFNFAVKNQTVKLVPDEPKAIEDRSISDYFTGIFFTDILGLNSNNENSLIVAEAQIKIPFHLRNYKILTFVDHFSAYVRLNLFSGFESGNRKVDLPNVVIDDIADYNESDQTFKTNNFNLFTNNNLDAGLQIVPLTLEWKGAASFINLRYGLRFLRTGVQYNLSESTTTTDDQGVTTTDVKFIEQRNFQVYATGHEAEINVAIRRQGSLIGADITGGLNWISETGTNKDNINLVTTNNTPNFKMELNLYAFTDSEKSNSGVFARLGMNYNLGNSRGYPQLLVGYATNLTSFVNKLSGDEKK